MCIIYVTYIYILIQTIIHITLKILKGTKKTAVEFYMKRMTISYHSGGIAFHIKAK